MSNLTIDSFLFGEVTHEAPFDGILGMGPPSAAVDKTPMPMASKVFVYGGQGVPAHPLPVPVQTSLYVLSLLSSQDSPPPPTQVPEQESTPGLPL